jgi:hypothetical protein
LDFSTAVEAVEELVGIEVSASFWGLVGHHAAPVGTLQGELKSRHTTLSEGDLPASLREALGEEALTFPVGDHWGNDIMLWPSRFVSAERIEAGAGVAITTLDGIILVRSNRPWID